jgi:hypothetical protein
VPRKASVAKRSKAARSSAAAGAGDLSSSGMLRARQSRRHGLRGIRFALDLDPVHPQRQLGADAVALQRPRHVCDHLLRSCPNCLFRGMNSVAILTHARFAPRQVSGISITCGASIVPVTLVGVRDTLAVRALNAESRGSDAQAARPSPLPHARGRRTRPPASQTARATRCSSRSAPLDAASVSPR